MYNAITELLCASFYFLAMCQTDDRSSSISQADLADVLHSRAENFYGVMKHLLEGKYATGEGEPASPAASEAGGRITAETVKKYRGKKRPKGPLGF